MRDSVKSPKGKRLSTANLNNLRGVIILSMYIYIYIYISLHILSLSYSLFLSLIHSLIHPSLSLSLSLSDNGSQVGSSNSFLESFPETPKSENRKLEENKSLRSTLPTQGVEGGVGDVRKGSLIPPQEPKRRISNVFTFDPKGKRFNLMSSLLVHYSHQ